MKYTHARLLVVLAVLAAGVGFPLAQTQTQRIEGNLQVAVGAAPSSGSRLYVKGATADATTLAFLVQDSVPTNLVYVRNDGYVQLSKTGGTVLIPGFTGMGVAANTQYRLYVKGEDTGATNFAIVAQDSAGVNLLYARNDGLVQLSKAGGIVTNFGRYNSAAQQPGFLAYNSVSDAGVTNLATIDFDTEVYDNAGNFSGDTFTAPVTGQYLLCATVTVITTGLTAMGMTIHTSNNDYQFARSGMQTNNSTEDHATGCVLADMDASDTAFVQMAGSATTVGGGASPIYTHFSGRLLP